MALQVWKDFDRQVAAVKGGAPVILKIKRQRRREIDHRPTR